MLETQIGFQTTIAAHSILHQQNIETYFRSLLSACLGQMKSLWPTRYENRWRIVKPEGVWTIFSDLDITHVMQFCTVSLTFFFSLLHSKCFLSKLLEKCFPRCPISRLFPNTNTLGVRSQPAYGIQIFLLLFWTFGISHIGFFGIAIPLIIVKVFRCVATRMLGIIICFHTKILSTWPDLGSRKPLFYC